MSLEKDVKLRNLICSFKNETTQKPGVSFCSDVESNNLEVDSNLDIIEYSFYRWWYHCM